MIAFVFALLLLVPCEPAKLILRSGASIWAECGWQRQDQAVFLKFREFQFTLNSDQVDWVKTDLAKQDLQGEPQPKTGRTPNEWRQLVAQAQPTEPSKPITLTNQSLAERKAKTQSPTRQGQRPADEATARIQKLKRNLARLRETQRQLRAQLEGEVTWRQAQFLMDQIDFIEQQIREKHYWLARKLREQKAASANSPKKTTKTSSLVPAASKAGGKSETDLESCATLKLCNTEFIQGGVHGQLNHHHRGSRA